MSNMDKYRMYRITAEEDYDLALEFYIPKAMPGNGQKLMPYSRIYVDGEFVIHLHREDLKKFLCQLVEVSEEALPYLEFVGSPITRR